MLSSGCAALIPQERSARGRARVHPPGRGPFYPVGRHAMAERLERRRLARAARNARRRRGPGVSGGRLAGVETDGAGVPGPAGHTTRRGPREDLTAIRAAADLLARLQRPDGSLGVSGDSGHARMGDAVRPRALDGAGRVRGPEAPGRRLAARASGRDLTEPPDPRRVIGTTHRCRDGPGSPARIPGSSRRRWPSGRLRRQGDATPEGRRGPRLIRDREIEAGGWNYGNKEVFGRELRPQPGPTGLALIASRARRPLGAVGRATDYLLAALPGTRASASLGWGLLGLRSGAAGRTTPTMAGRSLPEGRGPPRRRPSAGDPPHGRRVHAPELFPPESPR
jgi:hypothetical protein